MIGDLSTPERADYSPNSSQLVDADNTDTGVEVKTVTLRPSMKVVRESVAMAA